MKSIKDFLTIKQDKNTTIMDVFNEINLQDAASLKLESIYGYWCFNLGDTLEKFQKVVYTKDDTNYVLKLNSDDNKHHFLIKRDFCKIPTAKIRVKNKTYNGIESLENNTCKTIEHILSKQ